jgi:hypothetical protein
MSSQRQGDQIWAFLPIEQLVMINGDFLENFIWLILTKNGLGYIMGDFFHKLVWSP